MIVIVGDRGEEGGQERGEGPEVPGVEVREADNLHAEAATPNLRTEIIPTKIRRLETSGEFPWT